MDDLEPREPQPLSPADAARWDATKSAVLGFADAAVSGELTEEDVAATRAQLAQINLDMTTVLNAVHLPEDAGEFAPALEAILRRIPDGWGRWISCGPGWYPLLAKLDAALAAIDPGYEVHQVKEKFAGLRYYWGMSPESPLACCEAFRAEHPYPERDDREGWAVQEAAHTAHTLTDEHLAAVTVREPARAERTQRYEQMYALVSAAEDVAARTCELTGQPGILMSTNGTSGGWLQTLDPLTAPAGYFPIVEDPVVVDDPDTWPWDIDEKDDAVKLRKAALRHAAQEADLTGHVARLLAALRATRPTPDEDPS